MVTECFKDHWAFLDIEEPNSLTRELMFDSMFMVNDDNFQDEDGNDEEENIEHK